LFTSELFSEVTSEQTKSIISLSKKNGFFDKIAFLMVFSDRKDALREALYNEGLSGKTLLAASLAYEARLVQLKSEPVNGSSAENDENTKSKKGKNKKYKKSNISSSEGKDWLSLLSNETNDTLLQYVALAGALNNEASILEMLKKYSSRDAFYKICELMITSEQGANPTEKEILELYQKCKRISHPYKQVDGALSSLYILIPPQALLAQWIGKMPPHLYAKVLATALEDRDLRVKIDAIRAIVKTEETSLLPNLGEMLTKECFPVQIEIIKALVAMPDPKSIPYLVESLKKEDGFLRRDIFWALSCFAGETIGTMTGEFLDWYESKGKELSFDLNAFNEYKKSTSLRSTLVETINTEFYDLDIISKKFVYIVDTSSSMNGERIASLIENLEFSLKRISYKGTKFNIVDFGGDISELQSSGLTSDTKKGIAYVRDFNLSSTTRSFDAFERAFALPDFDTVLFLSDGAPTGYQLKQWNDIIPALAFLNQYRNVVIDCVEFGAGDKGLEAMQSLSNATNGRTGSVFIEVDPEFDDAKEAKKKKK
jgi:hypothetical protein